MLNPDAMMTNPLNFFCQSYSSQSLLGEAKLTRRESRVIQSSLTIGWLVGLTVVLAGCSPASVSDSSPSISPVPGDSISSEEVQNYAKAVLAIEQSRQEAYTEIQQLTNDEQVPDITCTQADTIAVLPLDVRDIAVNYCNRAKEFVENQDLTMSQFNTITVSAQADQNLQTRIKNELIRLQR